MNLQVIRRWAAMPRAWGAVLFAAIAVGLVTSAVSQPKQTDDAETAASQSPAESDANGNAPLFKAYVAPEADVEAAAKRLQAKYPRERGVRVAADVRTGKLLIVAPPKIHAELAVSLKAADETAPSKKNATRDAGPRAQKTLALKNAKAQEFEANLAALVGRQLPVTTQQEDRLATYALASRSGTRVALTVDRTANTVSLDGPTEIVDAWIRVAGALDVGAKTQRPDQRAVQIRNPAVVESGSIEKALSLIGKQIDTKQQNQPGRLVSMTFQPREEAGQPRQGAAAQAQPQPDATEEEKNGQQPPATAVIQVPGAAEEAAGGGLIGPVQIEFLEGLDVIVIRGNPRDVERVTQIIQDIERLSTETVPVIEIVNLRHTSSEAMANLVRTLYDQVLSARQGRVSITALVKPNALLLIGREDSVASVMELVRRLDVAVAPETQFRVFPLRHMAATEAEATVQEYITGLPPGQQQQQVAAAAQVTTLAPRGLVIADFRTNSLVVRAAERDLEEIDALLRRLDVPTSGAVNELRVFQLRNSLASELAPVLQNALTGQGQRQQTGQQGGQGQQFQQFQQQQQQQQQQQRGGRQGAEQTRSTMLELYTFDAEGRRAVRSGILTDVRITADASGNTLLVSAPPESMGLIAALIAELDQIPTSTAQIKVFQVVNGDAQTLVTMLQQLFGLQVTGGAARPGQGQLFQNLGAILGGGLTGDDPLVSLRFSVDPRTNSIIASGSVGDLAIVEAILLRLDAEEVRERQTIVYRLKYVPADSVATAINTYLQSQRQLQQIVPLTVSPFEQLEREVIVVQEPVSNSLIVSATPRYFEEIRKVVEQLDDRPPMVMIQVLIAEVALTNTDEFGVEIGLQDSVLFDRSLLGDLLQTTTTTTFGNPPTTVQQQNIVAATNTPGFLFNNLPLGNSGSSQALANSSDIGTQGLSHFAVGRTNQELGFGGLVLSASSEAVSFLLRALSESRRLDVLARPQVMTLDNQPAFVQVGQRVPRITSSTITEVGQTNATVLENVGLILQVWPRITRDNQVVMQIDAERSEVGPEAEGIPISINVNGDVIRSPRINTTIAQTTVLAANGQTVILSGLITKTRSETHRRVPFLSEIPILGHLFRYDNVQNRRTELLIIMTPRVVRTERDAEIIKQVESARMSWCLADVIKLHGDGGFRGRSDEWTDAETIVVHPDLPPDVLRQLVPGEAEEVAPPPADPAPRLSPPRTPPPMLTPPDGSGASNSQPSGRNAGPTVQLRIPQRQQHGNTGQLPSVMRPTSHEQPRLAPPPDEARLRAGGVNGIQGWQGGVQQAQYTHTPEANPSRVTSAVTLRGFTPTVTQAGYVGSSAPTQTTDLPPTK